MRGSREKERKSREFTRERRLSLRAPLAEEEEEARVVRSKDDKEEGRIERT